MNTRLLGALSAGAAGACMLCLPMSAAAIDPIPETPGWSGMAMFGVGYTDVKSNTVVGNDIIDVGDDTVNSIFQRPQSDDTTHPVLGLEVKYTFKGRSQVFLGSSLEDQLTMDFANQLGWRKQTDDLGTFQLGYLLSEPAVEVWEDPYLTGTPRSESDREAAGFRFEWDNVMGSSFGFLAQTREIDIENERSGTNPELGCDRECQLLLDRNGDQNIFRAWYRFMLAPNQILEPQIRYRDEDRDGAAKAREALAFQLSYAYFSGPWTFVGNLIYGSSEYDRANPLYGRKQDATTVAVDATVLYTLPSSSGRWQMLGTVFVGESDSDIGFHDNELTQAAVGIIYNYGQTR